MKYFLSIIVILFSISSSSKQEALDFKSWQENGSWGIFPSKPDSRFNPLKIKKYKENYNVALSYIIKILEKQDVNNKFCLIGYNFDKNENHNEFKNVIIFWKNADYLINWEIPDGDYGEKFKSILYSKPFIDINDSVVPYKEAQGASTLFLLLFKD